jgi:signal transduction histidine kinase/ActR/RegA family two-component response regulator
VRPSPENLLDYREFPVLYVDDEQENLRMFVRGLRREFTVRTAAGAAEGLALVREEPVAVVLSDQRMAGTSGVEFLASVRELDPKAIRILVTAYGDAETLSGAINDGFIYRYVAKPWTVDELLLTVRRAIEVYALDRERDELVRELSTLHWVSKTLARELDLGALSRVLLGTIVDELGFAGATLLLFDDAGQTLSVHGARPGGPEAAALARLEFTGPSAQPFFRRLAAGEVRRVRAARAASPGADPVCRTLLEATGAGEALVLPLVGRSRALGALVVDDRGKRRSFGASEATLLEGISSQAGIAVGNARLVEALRRSRQEVQRAERLGTLGTLAAGLAHEINNPLVSIHTFLSLAPGKRFEDDAGFWGDYHDLACREVERIRGLVATMSRLGRGGDPAQRGACDLGELAGEVVTLLAREARRRGVELEAVPEGAAPRVWGVREQLQQVVLNLVLNALQATPPEGRIAVRTLADARGEGACLEVRDSGAGIPPEDLERIFDPFYTTKDPDQGTGLGLTICHGIVSEHGGSIEVESLPGAGTTFRVRLPGRAPASGAAPAPDEGLGA